MTKEQWIEKYKSLLDALFSQLEIQTSNYTFDRERNLWCSFSEKGIENSQRLKVSRSYIKNNHSETKYEIFKSNIYCALQTEDDRIAYENHQKWLAENLRLKFDVIIFKDLTID